MPCMCWYDPEEEDKKYIKDRCVEIIAKVRKLNKIGDPLGCNICDVHELLDHLYDPSKCKEKKWNGYQ